MDFQFLYTYWDESKFSFTKGQEPPCNNKFTCGIFGSIIFTDDFLGDGPEFYKNFTLKEEDTFKYQAILYEQHLVQKTVVICKEGKESETSALLAGISDKFCVLAENTILSHFPQTIEDRKRRIILNLFHKDSRYGNRITEMHLQLFFAISNDEQSFFIDYLEKDNFVETEKQEDKSIKNIRIGMAGWKLIEKEQREAPRQAFIARWFKPSMKSTGGKIYKAVTDSGFNPMEIDNKEHNNEISGEILYEIKRSRFLVADVTGGRQGVYFEAGFAKGLGLPVIWTCRHGTEAELKKWMHFDTRQYNHILWENEDDLYDKLINRIKGTILIKE
jgi:hypothetical protein